MSKNVILLSFISFFTDMASAMITTSFPLFLVYVLKNGIDKLGLVIGIATFVSYFFRVIFGIISDKIGKRKPFLVLGYIISNLSKPLFYFVNSWKGIALLRSLDRFGKALRTAPKDALLSEYKEKGKVFGLHKALDVAGEAFGAAIVFLFFLKVGINEESFRIIFLSTLIPGTIAVFLTFFIKDVKTKKEYRFDISKDKKLLYLVGVFTFAFLFVVNESFFIVEAKKSVSMLYIPLFVILMNFIQSLFSYPLGIIIEKTGEIRIFLFSLFIHLCAFLALFYGKLYFAFILEGLFLVSFFNSVRIFIANNAYNKASVFGIFYLLFAVFGSVGSIVIGYLWQNYGINSVLVYILSGIIITILGVKSVKTFNRPSKRD